MLSAPTLCCALRLSASCFLLRFRSMVCCMLAKERLHLRIESIDETMLGVARVVSQRLCAGNDNLIRIGPEHPDSLGDKLVEGHCLLSLLTIHQFRAHPGWRDFQHADFSV